jgi:hypothetical protein
MAGTLTVQDSFLTANTASAAGGGIYNDKGTLLALNSVISGNVAPAGADLFMNGGVLINIGERHRHHRPLRADTGALQHGRSVCAGCPAFRSLPGRSGGVATAKAGAVSAAPPPLAAPIPAAPDCIVGIRSSGGAWSD